MPKLLLFFILAESFIGLFYNILNPRFPKIPGDFYIDKPGFRIYIPIISAIILSIAANWFFGNYVKGF